MSPLATTILLAAAAAAGVALVIAELLQPAPTLARTLEQLRRRADPADELDGPRSAHPRMLTAAVQTLGTYPRLLPSAAELRLAGRSLDEHVMRLVGAGTIGLLGPPLLVGAGQAAGWVGLGVFAPAGASLIGVLLGPFLVHSALVAEADRVRSDLRYQVSAYLDVVTMLLAGNAGYEGALEQAAHAGDGRLFVELRRRMRESSARGASLTEALARTGADLGLDELEQVAATAALSAAEGAPVARTLSAKCATLRSALSAEQESEARLRTSRLTTPIVGMALVFMALVMYPALTFS